MEAQSRQRVQLAVGRVTLKFRGRQRCSGFINQKPVTGDSTVDSSTRNLRNGDFSAITPRWTVPVTHWSNCQFESVAHFEV